MEKRGLLLCKEQKKYLLRRLLHTNEHRAEERDKKHANKQAVCFELSALPAAATNHFSHKHTYAQINQNTGSSISKYYTSDIHMEVNSKTKIYAIETQHIYV